MYVYTHNQRGTGYLSDHISQHRSDRPSFSQQVHCMRNPSFLLSWSIGNAYLNCLKNDGKGLNQTNNTTAAINGGQRAFH
jgi:hypothetical protein